MESVSWSTALLEAEQYLNASLQTVDVSAELRKLMDTEHKNKSSKTDEAAAEDEEQQLMAEIHANMSFRPKLPDPNATMTDLHVPDNEQTLMTDMQAQDTIQRLQTKVRDTFKFRVKFIGFSYLM